jgi:uncharacterized protein (TIGR03067 family)
MESRGRTDSGVSFQGMRYSFDNETWTTWAGGMAPAGTGGKEPLISKYMVDNSKDPEQLNMILSQGQTSVTKQAIYKIEDDKLSFASEEQSDFVFTTSLQRPILKFGFTGGRLI